MKTMKKLATVCMALMLAFGVGAFAACDKDNSSDSSPVENPMEQTGYKFKVVDQNGNPVEGVVIQLCLNTCECSEKTDANGLVAYEGADGEAVYEIHVCSDNPMFGGTIYEHTGATHTPATYNDDAIVLTINK